MGDISSTCITRHIGDAGLMKKTQKNKSQDKKEITFVNLEEVFNGYGEDWIIDFMVGYSRDVDFDQSAKGLIDDLTSKIAENDQNHYLYGMRGFFYETIDMKDKATEDYAKAISLNQKEALYQKGHLLNFIEGSESREEAVKLFSEAIKLDVNFINAYLWRAHAYNDMCEPELAIDDYSKVIELNGGLAYAYSDRGSCFGSLASKNLIINGNKDLFFLNLNKALIDFNKFFSIISKALKDDNDFDLRLKLRVKPLPAYLERTIQLHKNVSEKLKMSPIELENHMARFCSPHVLPKAG